MSPEHGHACSHRTANAQQGSHAVGQSAQCSCACVHTGTALRVGCPDPLRGAQLDSRRANVPFCFRRVSRVATPTCVGPRALGRVLRVQDASHRQGHACEWTDASDLMPLAPRRDFRQHGSGRRGSSYEYLEIRELAVQCKPRGGASYVTFNIGKVELSSVYIEYDPPRSVYTVWRAHGCWLDPLGAQNKCWTVHSSTARTRRGMWLVG